MKKLQVAKQQQQEGFLDKNSPPKRVFYNYVNDILKVMVLILSIFLVFINFSEERSRLNESLLLLTKIILHYFRL